MDEVAEKSPLTGAPVWFQGGVVCHLDTGEALGSDSVSRFGRFAKDVAAFVSASSGHDSHTAESGQFDGAVGWPDQRENSDETVEFGESLLQERQPRLDSAFPVTGEPRVVAYDVSQGARVDLDQ